ncbi:alpha/beta hydrolase [Dyadobacter chenwenxiniae]|uniref:Alpha/beta hydrolase n=1 Tax=Dyadobacter chenwenxiniae TaxID=2906456 RepID=A0A9X1TEU9_9BACT|nr:alpha/beta hydrolase [Dyadobacter chenwenxiniae]MCF0062004.1 alpha/beta hydrolase [Dyadobacter chenwenxiniae]UON81814.1 alpha/beta hydrolase [Dyadobacter chenwenxiniae]
MPKVKSFCLTAFISFLGLKSIAQTHINLYPGTVPNSISGPDQEVHAANTLVDSLTSKVSIPGLTIFLPAKEKATGTAVIICPGGGYGTLLTKREGSDVARAFNKLGIAAFVVKYRLPDPKIMKDQSIGPIQDAQQAIKIVRERATEFGIDPTKIGIMGFSAGGHLASTAGTHFETRYIDEGGKTSLRPDFMILINPVVSFNDTTGHIGSRDNLLGKNAGAEKIRLFSNELQVTKATPPTFLVHSGADVVVPAANSIEFYKALNNNGVPGALHIYSKGEHGFLTYPTFEEWFGRVMEWMNTLI